MSNEISYEDTISQLAAQADAVGRLAQDSGGFAAVFAAFESKDPNAFRWVLERLTLIPQCELICEWVRTKLCVLRCIEVCGFPPEKVETPNLQQFARAIVQLASDEKLLRRVVDAVSCGNAEDYQAAISELQLTNFCHLICHWVCSIVYHRVCEVVCRPERVFLPDAVSDIQAAAKVISSLLEKEKAFDAISRAAIGLNCEKLQTSINEAGVASGCVIICRLICTWRCAWVCRELCWLPVPVVAGTYGVEEAREFALASLQLAGKPRLLGDLVTAVQDRNAEAYSDIIARLRFEPYCHQVCAWVCSRICHEFCYCVCPNPALDPWFTTVGYFNIYSDIDGTTGKTNKGLPPASLYYSGGPNFAFYDKLQFGGFCPSFSPTVSGVAMKYRFLYTLAPNGPLPITSGLVSPVEAGTRLINWPQNLAGIAGAALVPTFQTITIVPGPKPDPTPPAVGSTWVGPSAHYIVPDGDGWVTVDPNAIGGGFQVLMGFDTAQPLIVPGGPPAPGVPAGTAVPAGAQRAGTDLAITFQATRVTTLPPGTTPDFTNQLNKIHINNWTEVNELNFAEFVTSCCTGIDQSLGVQFTVDHEEMDAGAWSLVISSCSGSAPGDITPTVSSGGVTVSARGGSGTIVEDTSTWISCSYTVTLTTRPGLTTGLVDRLADPNPLTFCICDH